MMPFFTKLSIGFDSFKDALYWWIGNMTMENHHLYQPTDVAAFWVELNSGYYQLHPEEYTKIYFTFPRVYHIN